MNNSGLMCGFFAAIMVLVVVGMIVGALQAKKRQEMLRAFAARLGWAFAPASDYSQSDGQGAFHAFCQGDDRYAYNTMRGNVPLDGANCAAAMGDYHYKKTSGSGKDRHTTHYYFSYVLVRLPYGSTPDLLIRHEIFFDKIAGAIGFEDINFESAEFSRQFHVKSSDKRFAYDVIDPRMMEWLLAVRPLPTDVRGGFLCVTDGHRRWKPEEFQARLDYAGQFLARWPEHVKLALRTGAPIA